MALEKIEADPHIGVPSIATLKKIVTRKGHQKVYKYKKDITMSHKLAIQLSFAILPNYLRSPPPISIVAVSQFTKIRQSSFHFLKNHQNALYVVKNIRSLG